MNEDTQRADALAKAFEAARGIEPMAIQSITAQVGGAPLVDDPDQTASNTLWIIFVAGLTAALILAVGGFIFLLADGKTTDALVTAFTAVLTGLLGLFSPSPVKAKKG